MKTTQLFFASICICVSLSGCMKEINEPDPIAPPITGGGSTHFGSTIQLNVAGQVFDETGEPLEGVVINSGFGNQTTATDANGAFILQGITGYDRLGYITANKPGYFTGSRSFLPVDGTSAIRITLLGKNLAGTIPGNSGGSVSAEGVQITFSPGSIMRNGAAYNGAVSVALNHIDPSSEELFQQMPGALIGTMDNSAQMLRSFGMVGVELTDGAGTEVEIADGSSAEVRFPVPSSMMGEAPSSIDLWSFDEDLGHWVHEGQAQLEGSEYVASVGHFSWWNCDIPMPLTYLEGEVLDQNGGQPLGGVRVRLSAPSLGDALAYTNAEGKFGGVIPSGQSMDLQISMVCSNGDWEVLHTGVIGPFDSPSAQQIMVETSSLSTLMGTVVTCEGIPVSAGYVMANGQAHFCNGGQFNFTICADYLEIFAVDQANGMIGASEHFSPLAGDNNLGMVSACGETVSEGTVTDIDGNVYPTVLIGTQEWMALNLRVTKYSNGEPIPSITVDEEWVALTTGALSLHYYNNPILSEIERGYYYNWFAVSDPRNVCPSGWHVPSDDEFKQLELILGMPLDELDLTSWRGEGQNVGGKMKAVINAGFGTPNIGATNESGFAGGGWGFRHPGGTYSSHYYAGQWWTSSEKTVDHAWFRLLAKHEGSIMRHPADHLLESGDKCYGMSVRCVRD